MGDGIKGAGGGGDKKQHTPVEAPDSLHSVAYARIDDLVSEGPIRGLANGLQSVFFNETPLANEDGTLNFKNVQIDWRWGSQDQTSIPGFGTVENEIAVQLELKHQTPWTQALSDTSLDAFRVRISTPMMSKTDTSNGDVNGSSVAYAIEVATDGGAFATVLQSAITGKTTTKYERSHRIDLPRAQTGWIVRVRRVTPDATSATLLNQTYIESFTELVDAKLRYPNSAHIASVFDSSQFQSIPARSFDLFGYEAVPVPSNYDPEARTYSGVWDGTFKPAWTDNPAWHFNLLITHKRFGLGHLVDQSQVNKWALYRIARWCDEMVPDGFGGMEPRLTCNLFMQTQEDAYKVLSDMASIFRGVAFWAGGAITASADQPSDPAYLYTPANVIDGRFEYAGSGKRARHTVALVSWNDPQDFYRPKIEYVEDAVGIARYGINQTEVIAIGSTSRGQARRLGRAILTTERYETDVVTFRVGLDGAHGNGTVCAPGQWIAIADPLRAGKRMGGRIASATETTVVVDKLPDEQPSAGAVLNVIGSDGAMMGRLITGIDRENSTVTVGTPFDTIPVAHAMWAIDDPELKTAYYRVLSVTNDAPLVYTINALQVEPDKYDFIDTLDPIEPRPVRETPVASLIQSVVLTKFNRTTSYNTETVISADWEAPPNTQQYEVQWRKDDGNWTPPVRQRELHSEWPKAFPGSYLCRVTPIGANGKTRSPTYSNLFTWADDEAPPSAIDGITGDVDEINNKLAQELEDRLRGDAALAQQIIDEATARANALIEEAQQRTDAIAAEASARATAILNEKLAREAAISTEQQIRQSEDESLAVAISLVSAGSGEQFDSRKIWYYDTDLESWSGNGTPTITDGWMRPANHATDPWIASPTGLAVEGQSYRFVKMRIKRVGTPAWQGQLRWRLSGDAAGAWRGPASIPEPEFDAAGVTTVAYQDVAWWPGTIDQIRIDLSTVQNASNYFLIDWVAVGRPTPGAGVALVQDEAAARIAGDSAEASQRNTLAVQLRGGYTGTDVASVTQGLVYSERQARISADGVIASDVSSLQARMPAGAGTLATEASVTAEASARASADGALSTRTGAIEARMPAGNGALATDARVTSVETASAAGDAANAAAITQTNSRIGQSPDNLVRTGDFESGVAGEWAGAGVSVIDIVDPYYSKALNVTDSAAATAASFPVMPNEVFRASAMVGTGFLTSGQVTRLGLRFGKKDGSSAGILYFFTKNPGDPPESSGTVTAPADAVTAYYQIIGTGRSTWRSIRIERDGIAAAANASGLSVLSTVVTSHDGIISAHSSQISSLQTDVAGKASSSAVSALDSRVSSVEGVNTSQSSSITALNASVGSANASITSLSQVVAAASVGNALANPSFEDGDNGWSFFDSNAYIYTALGATGNNSLRLQLATSATNRDLIPVKSGQTVRLSMFLRSIGSAPSSGSLCRINVRWYDATKAQVAYLATNCSYTSNGSNFSFTKIVGATVAPTNAVYMRITIISTATAGAYLVDDVTVEPLTDIAESAYASVGVTLDVNNNITGYRVTNDGRTGIFSILSSVFRVVSAATGAGMEWQDGYLRIWKGAAQLVIGSSFGSDGDLILWYGPIVAVGSCTKTNGTIWFDSSANAYFGGSLSGGTLKNAVQTTTTVLTGTELINGPFATNGKTKTVVVSFYRSTGYRSNAGGTTGFTSSGSNTAVVRLYRKIGTGAEALVGTLNAGGNVTILNETDGADQATSTWSGALTITDSVAGTGDRTYRAYIESSTSATVSHPGTINSTTTTQNLSIISTEPP